MSGCGFLIMSLHLHRLSYVTYISLSGERGAPDLAVFSKPYSQTVFFYNAISCIKRQTLHCNTKRETDNPPVGQPGCYPSLQMTHPASCRNPVPGGATF